VRRFDCPQSQAAVETMVYANQKFLTVLLRSEREGVGHPQGCNELWAGTMDLLSANWKDGGLNAHSVFTIEADGVPLCSDWLNRVIEAHAQTIRAGKRVTGPEMNHIPHVNGSLVAHLSLWEDRPSLHTTPKEGQQGWDLFHAAAILSEARATRVILNVYGACDWSDASLEAMSRETAWLASQKDDSALEWAERTIVSPAAAARRWKEEAIRSSPRVEAPRTPGRTYLTACRQHEVPILARSMLDHCEPFTLNVVAWDWDPGPNWGTEKGQFKYITRKQFLARHPEYEHLPGPPRQTINMLDAARWRVTADLLADGAESVTYVDGDQWFFSSPEPVFKEIGAARLAVTPHGIPPAAAGVPGVTFETHRKYGFYNSGFWYVADAGIAGEMADACFEWCYSNVVPQPDGTYLFGDQGHLERVAHRRGALVIQHPGVNVAPWNVHAREIEQAEDGTILAGGRPLITYHFSQFRPGVRAANPEYAVTPEQERLIYPPYLAELKRFAR
jgi:hypothetical protein